jgi:alanine or glycine:cation symporter, AGCS family
MSGIGETLAHMSNIAWGPPMLILLFGTHIYLTFRLRVIQRYTWRAIKISLSRSRGTGASGSPR